MTHDLLCADAQHHRLERRQPHRGRARAAVHEQAGSVPTVEPFLEDVATVGVTQDGARAVGAIEVGVELQSIDA